MIDQVSELKEKINDQLDSIRAYNENRRLNKNEVWAAEKQLKAAKYRLGQSTKMWVAARKKLKTLKSRLSSLPSRSRKWSKEHLAQVFSKIEDNALKPSNI